MIYWRYAPGTGSVITNVLRLMFALKYCAEGQGQERTHSRNDESNAIIYKDNGEKRVMTK